MEEFIDDPNYESAPILKLFSYQDYPLEVREVCRSFADTASHLDAQIKPGPLKDRALLGLLQARNDAVMAHLPHPLFPVLSPYERFCLS